MNKFAVYTGPDRAEPTADRLRDYFNTVTAGTAHVYVLTTKTAEELLAKLNEHGNGWSLRDIVKVTL